MGTQMVEHQWKIGDVTITITAPDGCRVVGATASIKPQTRAEFLEAAESVGGLAELVLPSIDAGYVQCAWAYPRREDNMRDTAGAVMLYEPSRDRDVEPPPPHPFFGPVADRRERERSPTASSPETRSGPGAVDEGREFPTFTGTSPTGAGAEPSAENPGGKP